MKNKHYFVLVCLAIFVITIPLMVQLILKPGITALAASEVESFSPVQMEDVGEISLQGNQKTIRFPANALNYDKDSTILTQRATGIR